jgi:two-component system CheB/CheR fusion protein
MSAELSPAGRNGGTGHSDRFAVRVLVVDDFPDNVLSMALLLRCYGHDVETASNGRAALQSAEASRPEVVLLDIAMPGMDGYEVARRFRDLFRDQIKIIALTAYGTDEDRQRSREAGFDRHLIKPADPQEVEALLRELANPS